MLAWNHMRRIKSSLPAAEQKQTILRFLVCLIQTKMLAHKSSCPQSNIPASLQAGEELARRGFDVRLCNVDSNGVLDLNHLNSLISDSTRLVSVMFGNNETGVIQPVHDVARICEENKILFHCDVVQAIGKVPVSFKDLNPSSIALTPHKFHGPRGIGVLIVKHDVTILPTMHGGFQQYGIRPGTESVALAIGAAHAIHLATTDESRETRMRQLRDRFESKMLEKSQKVVVIGKNANRLPHTSNIAFPNIDRQAYLMAADVNGIAISTGSACASGSSEPSHVLVAMNFDTEIVDSALRVSLGANTTKDEIDRAVEVMVRIEKSLRS